MMVLISFPKTGNCKYCGCDLYGCEGRDYCDKKRCLEKHAKEAIDEMMRLRKQHKRMLSFEEMDANSAYFSSHIYKSLSKWGWYDV
jgi:hypothetical protein